MKKLISALLCLGMLLSVSTAFAEEKSYKSDIFTYTVSGKTATITNVEDIRTTISVPEKLDGFLDVMSSYDISEVCRTGITGIESNPRR